MEVPTPQRILNNAASAKLRRGRSEVLWAAGFEVEETAGGSEMLDALIRSRPDLIIVEDTPDGAGIALCHRLKEDPATASIPIISMSATAVDAREAARALDGGADAYLVEPVHPENLVAAVRALLRFSRAERLSEALNRVNAAIGSTLDFKQIMERVVVEAGREIGADSAGILLLEDGSWVVRYTSGVPGLAGARWPDVPEVPGSISALAREDKPFVVDLDSSLPPAVLEAMERHSIRMKLFVPLRVGGRLTGLIGFHYHSARKFDAAQVDFAAKLGSAVSLALENARLYAEAEEGRKLLEALMRHIPHGIAISDAAGKIQMVSLHGREITGLGREVQGRILDAGAPTEWRLFRPGSDVPAQPAEVPLIRAIRNGSSVTNEEWLLETPTGERIPMLIDAGPIRNAAGEITGGVVAWQNILGWKRLEQELLNARKMEAIGLLAGGVAHEFNNMLTVITGHCQILMETSRSAKTREHLAPVLDAATRLASLTSELLGFAGRQIIRPAPISLNVVIEHMREALERMLGDVFVLGLDLQPGLRKVQADAGQIEHVIVSLVLFARDSMPKGGRIDIATRNLELSGEGAPGGCQLPPGKYVMISVRDTGPGLDPATVERLFEPFFNGKSIGRGASLALSAAYGAVKQNRGDIRVTSETGKGTRFDICLPQL
jgi:signal transduction histidine kinase/DNA-binding response OmpR family regulator